MGDGSVINIALLSGIREECSLKVIAVYFQQLVNIQYDPNNREK